MKKLLSIVAFIACATFGFVKADKRVRLEVTELTGGDYVYGVFLHNLNTNEDLLMKHTWGDWHCYTLSGEELSGSYEFRPVHSGDDICHTGPIDFSSSCFRMYAVPGYRVQVLGTENEYIDYLKKVDCPSIVFWTIRINPQGIVGNTIYVTVRTATGYEETIKVSKDPVTGWFITEYEVMLGYTLDVCWGYTPECKDQWTVLSGPTDLIITEDGSLEEDTNGPSSFNTTYTDPNDPAQKIIRQGNTYIRTSDKTYTIMGQKVQ